MPSWNETEFEKRAAEIARQHLVTKKSLNDLGEKAARDENLNPDEIRTLVRLANVETFQAMFKAKDGGGGDKNVEFEPGDAEQVINRLQSSPEGAPLQTANIENDKMASYILPDMMTEKRLGQKFDVGTEKVAEDHKPKPMKRDLAVVLMRKMATEFDIAQKQADIRWEDTMAKLAQCFRRTTALSLETFEKDAFAEYGVGVEPEVQGLRMMLRKPALIVYPEKVAHLQEHHLTADTQEIELVKSALAAREEYEKFGRGLDWVKNQLKPYGG